MATIEEILRSLDGLRKELSDLASIPDSEAGLMSAHIHNWENRAHEQLLSWWIPGEANSFSGTSHISIAGEHLGRLASVLFHFPF